MPDEKAGSITKNYDFLANEMNEMMPYWSDTQHLIRPSRLGRRGLATGGRLDKRFDSTASEASRILAFAMQAGMIPKSLVWLLYRIPDSDPASALNGNKRVADWLQKFSTVVWLMLNRSNFYRAAGESFWDGTTFHTSATYSEENTLAAGFQQMNFKTLPIGAYVFSENKYGRADTMYEPYLMTARQARQEFALNEELPVESLPQKIRDALKPGGQPDKSFEFLRYVAPRVDANPDGRFPEEMSWASFDIFLGEKSRIIRGQTSIDRSGAEIVRESGYNEFPYTVWRWSTIPGEQWGAGLTDIVMPAIKLINRTKMKLSKGLDQAIDPARLVNPDMMISRPKFNSGAIMYGRDVEKMVGTDRYEGRYDLGAIDVDKLREEIRLVYHRDFMILPGKTMTAEEVITLRNQLERFLGPNVDSAEIEKLGPEVERTAATAIRSGVVPEAPPELDNVQSIEPEYLGSLARAQRLNDVEATQRFLGATAAIHEVYPEAKDNIDIDEWVRALGNKLGVTDKVLRDVDVVGAIRQEQREIAEQQQAEESALNITKAIGQGAKAEELFSKAGVVA